MKPNISEILKLNSLEAAPLLLGCVLCRSLPGGGILKLRIVETEAYHQNDPASHSFRGMTKRTAPMFEAGGRLYIYFTYGMHYCLNIVTGRAGRGEAVLMRAAEPLEGIEVMKRNRVIKDIKSLANGPAKLTQALGIKDTSMSGKLLNEPARHQNLNKAVGSRIAEHQVFGAGPSIWIEPATMPVSPKDIVSAPRIGISRASDMPWRFYIRGNQFVSRYNKSNG